MDSDALVTEATDAGAEFLERLRETLPVRVAFWARPADAGQWYLYVASDSIDDQSLDQGYREVLRLVRQNPNPYLDPYQVRLIPATDPLARDAREIHRRYPGRSATRVGRPLFGDVSVEGVYIYPAPTAVPSP
jgi:hypothetical protein